ncbi:hypothetical protein E0H26_05970 [Micromonospora zingiberis]|uniref:Uncharacterized protein n=1 Tax=Micromonospora zingiberis TaxID=2053011 RepID=A0A4R0GSW4_9ACTN|nr:hypothetical protein [Micromonospora zingiberis]TCB98959.1 hypothetical protein E0H26_05970 [Micromonospora zingiberis]
MPAPVPADPRNKQLLTALFWGGVALAPVAALILLVADGNGPLRFAAVLAILAVVLIGLSIALRTDSGRQENAEELREELDELRRELRGEIVAAAQRGNQALDEAQRVQQALAGLRRRVEAAGAPVTGGEPAGGGRARVAAAEPEAPAQAGERPASPSGVYGSAQGANHGAGPAGRYDEEQAGAGYAERPPAGYAGDRPATGSAGVYGAAARPDHEGARPLGVVRHTETVHVTTRHTIVDGGVGESGSRYGGYAAPWSAQQEERPRGGPGADRDDRQWPDADDRGRRDDERAWSGPAREEEAAWSEPRAERQWSGHRDERSAPRDDRSAYRDDHSGAGDDRSGYRDDRPAYRDDRAGQRDDRGWGAPRDERGWDDGGQQWEAPAEAAPAGRPQRPDDTGEYWAQLRAGDRWAAVRDDDRGREFRVGERRAEVHADHTGTEYRMEDRWASVRRDEPRRAADGDEGRRDGWGEPEGRAALPAGGVPVPEEWRPPRQRGHQPEPARGHQPEAARGYQPEAAGGYQPEPARGYQPEAARGYQPEAAGGYQPEPARGYQPEAARGYQPEPAREYQPEPEPYGRRHRAEDTGYGPPAQDPNNRWR